MPDTPKYVEKWREDHPGFSPTGAKTWAKAQKLADDTAPAVSTAWAKAVADAKVGASHLTKRILADLEAGNGRRAARRVLRAWNKATGQFRGDLAAALTSVVQSTTKLAAEPHVGIDFDTMNARAQKWASDESGKLVTAMNEHQKLAVRQVISDGFTQRLTRRKMTRRLINEGLGLTHRQTIALANYRDRLMASGLTTELVEKRVARKRERYVRQRGETIARTETMRASNMGVQLTWDERIAAGKIDPKQVKKVWIVTYDDLLCPHCMAIDGQEVGVQSEFSHHAFGSVLVPPLHPRCVVGDTRVWSPRPVQAVFDRAYEGLVYVLRAAGAPPLTITPNHPVLTRRGWVRPGSLRVGDQLACDGGWGDRDGFLQRDEHDVPARIEDVARAFAKSGNVSSAQVPMSREDLHGDGVEGEVCVVRADGTLWNRLRSERLELGAQDELGLAHVAGAGLSAGRRIATRLEGPRAPAGCAVCGRYLGRPAVRRHLSPLQTLGVTASAGLDASLRQVAANHAPGDAMLIRERLLGGSGQVRVDDSGQVDALGPLLHTGLLEPEADDDWADPVLRGNLALGHTAPVVFRDLVDIDVETLNGHVYTLESGGSYVANSYIIANCRCTSALRHVKASKATPPEPTPPKPIPPKPIPPKPKKKPAATKAAPAPPLSVEQWARNHASLTAVHDRARKLSASKTRRSACRATPCSACSVSAWRRPERQTGTARRRPAGRR